MRAVETELKFCVKDVPRLRLAAHQLGFRLVTGRTFESNTLYDTLDRQLRSQRQVLRLRRYGNRSTLTHKRQADGDNGTDAPYKTRIETESGIDDCGALSEILAQLGYLPVFRYEKFRTEWEMHAGHLVLDETPIGVWAELEGPPEWIGATLEHLGIAPELQSTDSYGILFLQWKAATGAAVENLTFAEITGSAPPQDPNP